MLKIRPEGKPLFSDSDGPLMRDFLSRDHTATVEEIAAKTGRPLEIITDRNLITEYKYGPSLFGR